MRHLQLYTALREVVIEGSIRKAAEKLAISPSALNRKILALEDELGVPFFERLAGGVRLSTAGEVYYRHFIVHLAEIERAHATVADLSGMRIGHVRLAVAQGFEHGAMPNLLNRFRSEHPGVRFSLRPTEEDRVVQALSELDADLGVSFTKPFGDGAEVIGYAQHPVQALMMRRIAGDRTAFNSADMQEFDLILPPGGHGLRSHIDRHLTRQRNRVLAAVESAAPLPPTPHSAQLCLATTIDPTFLEMHDAVLIPVARVPEAEIIISKRSGRTLPVAAGKFAMALAAHLEQGTPYSDGIS